MTGHASSCRAVVRVEINRDSIERAVKYRRLRQLGLLKHKTVQNCSAVKDG